jgi:hypothetical protein
MALMYMIIRELARAHELLRESVRVKALCLPFTIRYSFALSAPAIFLAHCRPQDTQLMRLDRLRSSVSC